MGWEAWETWQKWAAALGVPTTLGAMWAARATIRRWAVLAWRYVRDLFRAPLALRRLEEQARKDRTVLAHGVLWRLNADESGFDPFCPYCAGEPGGPFPLQVPIREGPAARIASAGVAQIVVVYLTCPHKSHHPEPVCVKIDQRTLADARRGKL